MLYPFLSTTHVSWATPEVVWTSAYPNIQSYWFSPLANACKHTHTHFPSIPDPSFKPQLVTFLRSCTEMMCKLLFLKRNCLFLPKSLGRVGERHPRGKELIRKRQEGSWNLPRNSEHRNKEHRLRSVQMSLWVKKENRALPQSLQAEALGSENKSGL